MGIGPGMVGINHDRYPQSDTHIKSHFINGNDARNVAQNDAQNVAQDKVLLAEFIKEKVRNNNKITRKAIAEEAGVSVKTIERAIKDIFNLRYVGTGRNGHWELDE